MGQLGDRNLIRSALLLFFLSIAAPCVAQTQHSWQFFGGYSLQRSNVREYYRSTPIVYSIRNQFQNLNGWIVSITENVKPGLGGTLELSGHYKSPVLLGVPNRVRLHSILYGPHFAFKSVGGLRPFAHILVGVVHANATVTPVGAHESAFAFAGAAGGGLDVNLGKKAAFRALQVEYFRTSVLGTRPNSYRASAGIVLYLGK